MSGALGLLGIGSGAGWILYAIVFGAGVAAGGVPAYVWEHRAVTAAEAERDANAAQLTDARRQMAALGSSLEQFKAAVGARDAAIKSQAAEIERWKADSLAVKGTNDELVKAGRQDAERRLSAISAQEEETRAHPEDIHALSPRVRALADSLRSE
jgi:hypothetical protein